MTPERAADILKLFIPIIGATLCMIAGVFTFQIGWVAIGAGMLGVPFLWPERKI